MATAGDILLDVRGLTKSFGGNVVLSGVDLTLHAGEVHAIVGENGAGKSTLIKTLGGVHRPDSGSLLIDGIETTLRSPRDAIAQGVVVIHQELSLAPHLSVEENIFLGHFPHTRLGFVDRAKIRADTRELLGRLSIIIDPQRRVSELSIAQQQMVEIAKAISFKAKVLILDEPTAVLDEDMVATLFALIAKLKADGLGIVFISHHLEEIFRIADTVTVLRDGVRTGVSRVAGIDQDWLVSRMIGRDFPAHLARARKSGAPALEVENLTLAGRFENVSFTARQGEIVGLAGLVGAGRTEVAQAIVGITRPTSGVVKVFGKPVRVRSPNAAARLSIAYVSEDRKALGLLPNRPVRENATISNLARFRSLGLLNLARERAYVRGIIGKLDVRLSGMEVEIRTLSGGNQQKVLIGRALAVEPRILIFDEPTRGVDIGAKSEIYAFIEELVAAGMCVVLISSEMEEILRLADRVVVLRRGRVAATLSREEASETTIMRAAALAG
ncbi:sugar ABC transporter ATP-binding protein [Labrys monachus]|uniref:ABC-type sugar transport system ATPase subunit n=1 Tax=Labrys monachus TaxID=217067 RepID=A0ABU0FE85_9HYPH|nr:sugar ABC transporter ATP-binding protein [Labrys monachus]MDQ0392922.1 ABC-type sugar transport system ATPase subunit [Labrys monachus]